MKIQIFEITGLVPKVWRSPDGVHPIVFLFAEVFQVTGMDKPGSDGSWAFLVSDHAGGETMVMRRDRQLKVRLDNTAGEEYSLTVSSRSDEIRPMTPAEVVKVLLLCRMATLDQHVEVQPIWLSDKEDIVRFLRENREFSSALEAYISQVMLGGQRQPVVQFMKVEGWSSLLLPSVVAAATGSSEPMPIRRMPSRAVSRAPSRTEREAGIRAASSREAPRFDDEAVELLDTGERMPPPIKLPVAVPKQAPDTLPEMPAADVWLNEPSTDPGEGEEGGGD